MPLKFREGRMGKESGAVTEDFAACGMTLTVGIAPCRTAWVQKIKAASEQYIETEKRKREKAYQGTHWVLHFPLSTWIQEQAISWRMPVSPKDLLPVLTFQPVCLFLTSLFLARSQKTSGIGRLMVQVIEATELKACKPNGKWGKQSQSTFIPVIFGKACWEQLVIWESLWLVYSFYMKKSFFGFRGQSEEPALCCSGI